MNISPLWGEEDYFDHLFYEHLAPTGRRLTPMV